MLTKIFINERLLKYKNCEGTNCRPPGDKESKGAVGKHRPHLATEPGQARGVNKPDPNRNTLSKTMFSYFRASSQNI